MLIALGISFLVLLIAGVPISICMGLSSAVSLFMGMPDALITIPSKIFGGLDAYTIMAIPFFILAGNMMDACGISQKLVSFADALVGWLKGGLSYVVVVVSIIFAAITGSAAAATSAIGAILMTALFEKGYDKGFASSLVACGGTIGPIIPPSILAVLYAGSTGLSVGALFMAGVVPGLIMALAMMICCFIYVLRNPNCKDTGTSMSWKRRFQITIYALPALFLPVLIIGGIILGIFTPTESAAIGCIYAALVGIISRKLTLDKMYTVLYKSAVSVSAIMLIISCANLFSWILGVKGFPAMVQEFMLAATDSKVVAGIIVVIFLLIVGCFMETVAALNLLVPILYPIGVAFGFDPIHYAMIVICTLIYGAVTPPVGALLFISSGVAKIPFSETLKFLPPFLVALLISVLMVLIFPAISTWLPAILGY